MVDLSSYQAGWTGCPAGSGCHGHGYSITGTGLSCCLSGGWSRRAVHPVLRRGRLAVDLLLLVLTVINCLGWRAREGAGGWGRGSQCGAEQSTFLFTPFCVLSLSLSLSLCVVYVYVLRLHLLDLPVFSNVLSGTTYEKIKRESKAASMDHHYCLQQRIASGKKSDKRNQNISPLPILLFPRGEHSAMRTARADGREATVCV